MESRIFPRDSSFFTSMTVALAVPYFLDMDSSRNFCARPAKTKIKALFLNQKTSSSKLVEVEKVEPASGVRILISDKLNVIPGSPLIEIENDEREAYEEILKETAVTLDLSEHGVTLRADTLGSLEAIAYELSEKGIKIRNAQIGLISRNSGNQ